MTYALPDTRLIQEAARLAETNLPPTIYRHSQRTFLLDAFEPEFRSRFRRALGSWRACVRLVFPAARA